VGVDLGVILNGYQGDMARTFPVGRISAEAQALIETTRLCFEAAREKAVAGNRIGDIGYAVQSLAEGRGYGVVRDLCGHGIGQKMHEDPEVPNYGRAGRGIRLESGMVLALEPMINLGTWKVKFMNDGWLVKTADGSLSAHHENTVVVMEGHSRILTAI
jgi:methionyl aminopeptidase